MTSRVAFAGLALDLPEGWYDISYDGGPPTLARGEQGVGALQFSVARYVGGKSPGVRVADLASMLSELARSNELSARGELRAQEGRLQHVEQDFESNANFVRVYYLSDGSNIALVTFLCALANETAEETQEADQIVASIAFLSAENDT